MLWVAPKAMNYDLVSYSNEAVNLVFPYGFNPVFFKSPFPASWHDVVLLRNLLELPYLQLFELIQQFGNLVESIKPVASLDGNTFFVLGGLGCTLAAKHDTPWGEIIVFPMLVPFGLSVTTAAWRSVVGSGATTLVAPWLWRGVRHIFTLYGVVGNIGVVVRGFMSLDIMAFVRVASLLVDSYEDTVELIVGLRCHGLYAWCVRSGGGIRYPWPYGAASFPCRV